MPKSTASNPTLLTVGSHYIGIDYTDKVNKEECYPVLSVTWRGKTAQVKMEANRYVHSSGWSEWRIFIRDLDGTPDTGLARDAIRPVCLPVVEAWLASEGYANSRREAFAHMIRRAFRDERYSADRPAALLARYANELTVKDRQRFGKAVEHLREFLALTD